MSGYVCLKDRAVGKHYCRRQVFVNSCFVCYFLIFKFNFDKTFLFQGALRFDRLGQIISLWSRFFGSCCLLRLDACADGAVERLWCAVFGVLCLFVLRVHKWALAVLASKDFIRHVYIV